MKHFLPLAALVVAVCQVSNLPGAPAGRERLRFDDGWKFHLRDASLGPDPTPMAAGEPIRAWRWQLAVDPDKEIAQVIQNNFDDHAWKQTESGHELVRKEDTSAWFRTILPKAVGPRPRLHFAGVDDIADVYLNGKRVAQHNGWQDPFDVELKDAWNADGANVLVVLAQNVGGLGGMDVVGFESEATPNLQKAESGPAAVAFDDHSWRDVQLPHDFVVEGTFDPKADASRGFLPTGAA